LLDAMALAARRRPDPRLLIVTTLPQPHHVAAIRVQAERLGIARRVVVTEPQSLASVRDFLQVGDVAVVPRPAAAGFPIKLLNYMAASRAAAMFASSASIGIVDRRNAVLASKDTAQSLSEALVELLESEDLRRRVAKGGFDFVRMHHDRIAIAGQIADCYHRVLGTAGARERECHAYSS
jgi:glycosyltransferase involved in cell wall biosynthesis